MTGSTLFTARVEGWNELGLAIYFSHGILKNSDGLKRQKKAREGDGKGQKPYQFTVWSQLPFSSHPFAQHWACCRELTVNNYAWDGSVVKRAVKPEPLLPLSCGSAWCSVLMLDLGLGKEGSLYPNHRVCIWSWGGTSVAALLGWEGGPIVWSAVGFWRGLISNLQTGSGR